MRRLLHPKHVTQRCFKYKYSVHDSTKHFIALKRNKVEPNFILQVAPRSRRYIWRVLKFSSGAPNVLPNVIKLRTVCIYDYRHRRLSSIWEAEAIV